MGKINNYYYPDIDVKEAVDIATHVYNFPGHTMSVQMLAEKLGLKTRGGWTGMILASIKNLGLVEGRGILKTTELTAQLINPISERELSQAKLNMFNKIDLFKLIKADYGNRSLSSEFTGWLIEKISAERTEAQKKSKKIAKLYTDSEAFCFSPGSSTIIEEGRRENRTGSIDLKADAVIVQRSISELGTMTINAREQGFEFSKTLPFTKGGIDALKKVITFLETQLQLEEEEENR